MEIFLGIVAAAVLAAAVVYLAFRGREEETCASPEDVRQSQRELTHRIGEAQDEFIRRLDELERKVSVSPAVASFPLSSPGSSKKVRFQLNFDPDDDALIARLRTVAERLEKHPFKDPEEILGNLRAGREMSKEEAEVYRREFEEAGGNVYITELA